jgi:hypothetical protein
VSHLGRSLRSCADHQQVRRIGLVAAQRDAKNRRADADSAHSSRPWTAAIPDGAPPNLAESRVASSSQGRGSITMYHSWREALSRLAAEERSGRETAAKPFPPCEAKGVDSWPAEQGNCSWGHLMFEQELWL